MIDDVDLIAVVQCHIVKERCSGFLCERAFFERTGGFAEVTAEKPVRFLSLTCGGCCGKATHRKLTNLIRQATKAGIEKDRILVQLSSCMTQDNSHSTRCPHIEYVKTLIARTGLRCREDTRISPKAEQRRKDGVYGG